MSLLAGGAAACVASLGAACAGAAIGGIAAGSNAGMQCAVAAEKNNAGCFPGQATVTLPDGSQKRCARANNTLVLLLKGKNVCRRRTWADPLLGRRRLSVPGP